MTLCSTYINVHFPVALTGIHVGYCFPIPNAGFVDFSIYMKVTFILKDYATKKKLFDQMFCLLSLASKYELRNRCISTLPQFELCMKPFEGLV